LSKLWPIFTNLIVKREETLSNKHAHEDAGNGFSRAKDTLDSVSIVGWSFCLNFAVDVDDDFRANVDTELRMSILACFEQLLHVLEYGLETRFAVSNKTIFEFTDDR